MYKICGSVNNKSCVQMVCCDGETETIWYYNTQDAIYYCEDKHKSVVLSVTIEDILNMFEIHFIAKERGLLPEGETAFFNSPFGEIYKHWFKGTH